MIDWERGWINRRDAFAEECRAARTQFLAELRDPKPVQAAIFSDLLETFQDSLHWRREGLDRLVRDMGEFRRVIPIRRYDDFAPFIEEETHTKGGVLSCSPVLRWLKTSGTTGAPKRVPYTLHWVTRYRVPAMQVMWGTYLEHHPEILAHPHATLDTQTVREKVSDYVCGVEFQAISNRHPPVYMHDWTPPWHDAPWFSPDAPSSHERRMYCRLRNMIGKDLHFISSINPSTLISLREIMIAQGESLVRDIFNGTIESAPFGEPDPAAARRLEARLRDPGVSMVDVWPSLSLYSCWTAASASLYSGKLQSIFPGIDCLPFMGCGTEGVVTLPINASVSSQPLAINQAFYEFIPADDDLDTAITSMSGIETLLFDEVEVGREYHLIMTQGNGLYRLATGDIYRVDDMVDGVPWIQFVRRDGIFHSFTGEKITEIQFSQAITHAAESLRLDMGLYLCGPRWGSPPGYVVLLETPACGTGREAEIAGRIDHMLSEINIEYASKRDSERLQSIEVVTVPHSSIDAYIDKNRRNGNATQLKYKPFQKDVAFLADF